MMRFYAIETYCWYSKQKRIKIVRILRARPEKSTENRKQKPAKNNYCDESVVSVLFYRELQNSNFEQMYSYKTNSTNWLYRVILCFSSVGLTLVCF